MIPYSILQKGDLFKMPGPPPKPAHLRRRRNQPVYEWVKLTEAHSGPIPELPTGIRWTKMTRAWWATVWSSPMATQWDEGDVPALVELALLRQKMMAGEFNLSTAVEKRSAAFGLTPKGRRDLRWIITDKDAERAGVAGVPDESPVRRLRAVDPELARRVT